MRVLAAEIGSEQSGDAAGNDPRRIGCRIHDVRFRKRGSCARTNRRTRTAGNRGNHRVLTLYALRPLECHDSIGTSHRIRLIERTTSRGDSPNTNSGVRKLIHIRHTHLDGTGI
jgi:hypothetical protein